MDEWNCISLTPTAPEHFYVCQHGLLCSSYGIVWNGWNGLYVDEDPESLGLPANEMEAPAAHTTMHSPL